MESSKEFRSGFVALVGRPNAGKSTLMNHMVGQKVAIMSDKPQTTRNKIMGIVNGENSQTIFIDTPGIHKPRHRLGEIMVRAAESTLSEVDVVVWVVDCTQKMGSGDEFVAERLKKAQTPVILALNKIDLMDKRELLPLLESYSQLRDFAAVIPISAKTGENVDGFSSEISKRLPRGPMYFPEDMVTDQPERLIMAELIREKALEMTREEIPHAIGVEMEEITPRPNGDIYARAVIYVERDSQKGIVIGKKGAMLKEIGKKGREDIEALLGNKVFLELWVKVKKDWRNSNRAIQQIAAQ
jgi:GTP-binding protein Era